MTYGVYEGELGEGANLRHSIRAAKIVLSLIGRIGGGRFGSSFNQVSLAALILLQQRRAKS